MTETALLHFGEFQLDRDAFELRRAGERVPLERIPMELLFLLVCRKGSLVTREEIVERLWGSDVFIDTNTAINVAIRKVRQALDDTVDTPRYILTMPAKGYRFIAAVSETPAAALPVLPPAVVSEASLPETPDRSATPTIPLSAPQISARRRWIISLTALIFIAAIVTPLAIVLRHKPAQSGGKVMFVVLPFTNLTGDPAQEYIADGMTEEMITQLGVLDPARLGVIARTSSMGFKGTQKSAAEIARELGVRYLLEGSIRNAGARTRVTVQLIQATDQTHLWAADYDSDLGNLLQMESSIAETVASQVQVKLMATGRARYTYQAKPEAQAAYLRGLEDWNQRTTTSIANAISEFNRAIAADPQYALPYSALARCYVIGPIFGVGDPLETMPHARDLAAQALTLDPNLAEAHSMLAMVAAHDDFDWPTAEREFLTAIQLNPSDPYGHFFYSNSFLSPHGRHDEAIREMRIVTALDPLAGSLQSYVIRTYAWAGRYDDARAQLQATNEIAPNLPLLHERAAHLYAVTGDFHAAIEEDSKARLLSGEPAEQAILDRDLQLRALAQHGPFGYWSAQLTLSHQPFNPPEAYTHPFGLAVIHARLGDTSAALDGLEQAYTARDVQLTEINEEPAFVVLRSEPRFHALLSQLHLPAPE